MKRHRDQAVDRLRQCRSRRWRARRARARPAAPACGRSGRRSARKRSGRRQSRTDSSKWSVARAAVGACSARPMSGSDGRYMSIDSGPSAVRNDSNKVSANVPGRSIRLAVMGQRKEPAEAPSTQCSRICVEIAAAPRSNERRNHIIAPQRLHFQSPRACRAAQQAARIGTPSRSRSSRHPRGGRPAAGSRRRRAGACEARKSCNGDRPRR